MSTARQLLTLLAMVCVPGRIAPAENPAVKDAATARAHLRGYIGPAKLQADLVSRIGGLIRRLGADKWRDREDATGALLRIGPKARPWVRDALASGDTEIRTRAEQICKSYQTVQDRTGTIVTESADALARARDKWVIDALLTLLDNDSLDLRYPAEYGLRRLTGQWFGYNAYAAPASRQAAAGRWRAWWKRSRAAFAFGGLAPPAEPSGVIICDSTARKIQWISLGGKLLWSRSYPAEPYCAQPLANGNTFVVFRLPDKTLAAEYGPRGNVLLLKGTVADIQRLPNGNTLMTGPTGTTVREVDPTGKRIVWKFDAGGTTSCAERLANGNTLLSITSGGRVVEVGRPGNVVWSQTGLASPRYATRLANGHVLVVEHGRRRVVEFNRDGDAVWTFPAGSGYPVSACRTGGGITAIYDQTRGLVLVDKEGKILRTLSMLRPRHYEKVRLTPPQYKPPESKTSPQHKPPGSKKKT